MNNLDILQLCFGNLLRRRTRTILSVIGVVIGTCAIVVMISIGIGLSVSYQEQIESFGNLHIIEVYNWGSNTSTQKLDSKAVSKMETIKGVSAISPHISTGARLASGRMVADAQIIGISSKMLEAMGLSTDEGRIANASDKAPLVFGKSVAASFYDPRKKEQASWGSLEPTVKVLSKFIITNDYNYGTNKEGQDMGETKPVTIEAQGVGLLSNEYDEYAYNVYTTLEFAQEIRNTMARAAGEQVKPGGETYDKVIIYANDINDVADICKVIREDYGFSTFSLNDMLKEMQKTAAMIQAVLGGIGAISLLVAAIGIANTMIMSVYERTREISVMKVIGSSLKDIRKMFLLEAGMIGFSGGAAGLVFSYGISAFMNSLNLSLFGGMPSGKTSIIPVWLAIAALAFATFMGLISGYSPAQRAMKLSVLEGLKNE